MENVIILCKKGYLCLLDYSFCMERRDCTPAVCFIWGQRSRRCNWGSILKNIGLCWGMMRIMHQNQLWVCWEMVTKYNIDVGCFTFTIDEQPSLDWYIFTRSNSIFTKRILISCSIASFRPFDDYHPRLNKIEGT